MRCFSNGHIDNLPSKQDYHILENITNDQAMIESPCEPQRINHKEDSYINYE